MYATYTVVAPPLVTAAWMASGDVPGYIMRMFQAFFLRPLPRINQLRCNVYRPQSTFLLRWGSLCLVITQRTSAKMAAIQRNRFYGKWSRATALVVVADRPRPNLFLSGPAGDADAPVAVGSPSMRRRRRRRRPPKSKPRPRCRRLQSIFEEIVADVGPDWLSD